jgi:LysM repeat protein
MTSKKFGRVFVPVFVIAALVLSLFASPVLAQEQDPQTVGPAAQQQVPQEWLDDFEFENGRVYYVLAQGDTLQDVADRFGTTVDDIRDANTDIDEDVDENDDFEYNLYAGQPILIPEDAEAFEDYDFDTMDTTANGQQTGTLDPAFEADTDWDFETTDLEQLETGEVYYIVATGDSLQGIANRFNTTVQELEQLNAQWFDDQLYVGQPVQLPEEVFPLTPVTGVPPAEEVTPTPDPAAPAVTPTPDPAAPAVQPTPQPGAQVGTTPAEEDYPEDQLAQYQFQPGNVYYIVASGDTWQDIVQRTGVSSDQLQQANQDVDGDQLYVGQPIQLPAGTVPVTGQPGIPATGPDFRVTEEDIAGRNFMFQAPRGTVTNGHYIVTDGDNMSNLAQRMGVTLVELLDANPQIQNPNLIFRGEAITIPGNAHADFRNDPLAPAFGVDVGPVPLDRVPFHDAPVIPETGEPAQEEEQETDPVGTTPAEQEYTQDELDAFNWQTGSFYYIVAQGDTLQSIAQQFDMTSQDLANANPDVDAEDLRIGQPIELPADMIPATGEPTAAEPTEPVATEPTDPQVPVTGPAFGPDFRVTEEDVAGRIFMFQAPRGSITNGHYIVTDGDNMSNLAQRMGVTLVTLLDANQHIQNPNLIFRGEAIRIPGGVAQSFLDDPLAPAFGVDVGPVPMDRVPFTEQQQQEDDD